MAQANIEVLHYERRREARQTEPAPEGKSWKRKAAIAASVILSLATIGLGIYIYWCFTHVTTVRASVSAAVVSITSDTDARLKELCVTPGQKVNKGQKLVVLDNTEANAMTDAAEATRRTKENAYTQAQAQLRLLQQSVNGDIELAQSRLDAAQAAQREIAAKEQMIRKGARPEEIEAARDKLKSAKGQESLYAYQSDQMKQLAAEGIVAKITYEEKKTQLATQQNTVHQVQLDLDLLLSGATVEEREMINQNRAAREADVREAESQLRRAQTRSAEISVAEENVKAAAADLQRATSEAGARRAAAQRMQLDSPCSGTVIRTFVSVGELCRKGAPCIQIADDSEGRWVEGFVQEIDAPLVKIGQEAEIEIVVGSGEYIDATVSAIGLATSSVDASAADFTGAGAAARAKSPEIVWVKLMPKNRNIVSLPGMSARAYIRVR